jgi:chromosome transmission fidelity protein 1
MSAVYTTIRRGRLGVFESPTGTGKTLSLINSAMTWLREHAEYGSSDDEGCASGAEDAAGSGAAAADGSAGVVGVGGGGGGGGGGGLGHVSLPPGAPASGEPDWCVSFGRERSGRVRASALQRRKEIRRELSERLALLRLSSDEAIAASVSGGGAGRRAHRAVGGGGGATAAGSALLKRRREAGAAGAAPSSAAAAPDDNLVDEYHSDADGDDDAALSRRRAGWSAGALASMSVADRMRAERERGAEPGAGGERGSAGAAVGGGGGGAGGGGAGAAGAAGAAADGDSDDEAFRPKLFYVSRTHSQVSQFVHEIAKTPFGRDARVVALGARKSLCCNPAFEMPSSKLSRLEQLRIVKAKHGAAGLAQMF